MNSDQDPLHRLLDSAALAPRPLPVRVPMALETRVMAHWRRLPFEAGDLSLTLLPSLRRAAFCACLLMLLSIALSYRAITNGEDDVVMIANSAVDLTLLP